VRGESSVARAFRTEIAQEATVTHVTKRWVLASDVQCIGPVVEEIVSLCAAAGFSSRQCRLNVPVAITEALANAILQGNQNVASRTVVVVAIVSGERMVVDVTDEGQGFDVAVEQRSPDDPDWLEREDGRGIFLMRQLMDQVVSECLDAGHLLRLILHKA
jgi:serine/threonine-protein kinase RsbW